MMTMNSKTITLKLVNGQWMARHSDPAVRVLFGTDTLPTAYTSSTSSETVRLEIQAKNPEFEVNVQE